MVNDGVILPLVLYTNDQPVAYLITNRKGYEKSLERGDIWHLHPSTHRLLPLDGSAGCPVLDRGTHYTAAWLNRVPPALDWNTASSGPQRSTDAQGGGSQDVLEALSCVISQRRRELPDGSYTTHLFQKGEAKIRKKVGEEAIELLLAQDNAEIASETADFLYHLFVFLEVRQMSYRDILAVLKRRLDG